MLFKLKILTTKLFYIKIYSYKINPLLKFRCKNRLKLFRRHWNTGNGNQTIEFLIKAINIEWKHSQTGELLNPMTVTKFYSFKYSHNHISKWIRLVCFTWDSNAENYWFCIMCFVTTSHFYCEIGKTTRIWVI